MRACTPWVLLCVLVILILILAALLINNFTGTAAVAAIGGAALSKKRKRAKEIFGGDVKDFWDVDTDKVRTVAEETFTRPPPVKPFFPELQTDYNTVLVTQWVAIRDAFKKLSDDLDKAWKADSATAVWKGAARRPGIKMDTAWARAALYTPAGTRLAGSWRYAYDAFDGVLIQLGDLVDLYQKDSPSIADSTTTFPAIQGYLTTYFGTIRTQMVPGVPEQDIVVASVTALEALVSALSPTTTYAYAHSLPASLVAAMVPATITTEGLANNQTDPAMKTVIALWRAHVDAYSAWETARAAETEISKINNWDNFFKDCENKVGAIIGHFTKTPMPINVTKTCSDDKTQLTTAVGNLLALSSKKGWKWPRGAALITKLSTAANNLALCISPLPVSAVVGMVPATTTAAGVVNGHSIYAMGTVISLLKNHGAAYAYWRATRSASTNITILDSWDTLFKECENKVVAIIEHFTKVGEAAVPAVTKACNVNQKDLITNVNKIILASGVKTSFIWSLLTGGRGATALTGILNNYLKAAENLAFCLPPFPIFVATTPRHHEHIAGFASKDPAVVTTYSERVKLPTLGYHSDKDYKSVRDLNDNYYKFLTWWADARVNPNTYDSKVDSIATALDLQVLMENIGEVINTELDESYFERPVTTIPNKWNTTTSEKCAAAISKLKALRRSVDLMINITTPGKVYGTSPQPDWNNFKKTLNTIPNIDFVNFKRPLPMLPVATVTLGLKVLKVHQPLLANIISDLARDFEAVVARYESPGNTDRVSFRDLGLLTATDLMLANIYDKIAKLIAIYVKPTITVSDPEVAVATANSVVLDIKAFSSSASVKALSAAFDRYISRLVQTGLNRLIVEKMLYMVVDESFAPRPLTPSQRLIRYKSTPDVEIKFVKEVDPGAHGSLVLEASSTEELDAKLAQTPESKAVKIYGLVVDKTGDLTALYKAVAINTNNRISDELKKEQANVANAATGRLYKATWMPMGSSGKGAYYKEFIDYIKPALYAVV